MSRAFKRLEAEDKNFVTPKIYAQNSAFNQSIVVGDSLIGISLDKYMGADYPAYKKYFYENQRATMEPSRIVQDCLYFYLNQQFPPTRLRIRHTLGQWLIHQGKIAWVVAQLTNKSAIDIAACQPATKAWYKLNERRVWNTLRNEKYGTAMTRCCCTLFYIQAMHTLILSTRTRVAWDCGLVCAL